MNIMIINRNDIRPMRVKISNTCGCGNFKEKLFNKNKMCSYTINK